MPAGYTLSNKTHQHKRRVVTEVLKELGETANYQTILAAVAKRGLKVSRTAVGNARKALAFKPLARGGKRSQQGKPSRKPPGRNEEGQSDPAHQARIEAHRVRVRRELRELEGKGHFAGQSKCQVRGLGDD